MMMHSQIQGINERVQKGDTEDKTVGSYDDCYEVIRHHDDGNWLRRVMWLLVIVNSIIIRAMEVEY